MTYLLANDKACLESLQHQLPETVEIGIPDASEHTHGWLWTDATGLRSWLQKERGIFWIEGKPGCGKSTIMKAVWLHTQTEAKGDDTIVAAQFFSTRGMPHEKTFRSLLRRILVSSVRHRPELLPVVVQSTRDFSGQDLEAPMNIEWTFPLLKQTLTNVIAQREFHLKLLIVVDALDECGDMPIRDCITFFRELSSDKQQNAVRICFSSRNIPEDLKFGSLSKSGFAVEDKNSSDIANYVEERLLSMGVLIHEQAGFQELKSEILSRADGIFLWVKIVLDELSVSYENGATFAELQRSLVETPSQLNGLYRSLLAEVNGSFVDETSSMLAITMSALVPLNISEFRFATAFGGSLDFASQKDMENSETSVQDDVTMRRRIRSRTGGILEVKTLIEEEPGYLDRPKSSNGTVQMIHQSVKDFLLLEHPENMQIVRPKVLNLQGHLFLFRACVRYLKIPELRMLSATAPETRHDWHSQKYVKKIMTNFPFLNYALNHWLEHAQEVENAGFPQTKELEAFFHTNDGYFETWSDLYPFFALDKKMKFGMTPLGLAVQHGLFEYVRSRFKEGADVNESIPEYGHYLHLAVTTENENMIQLLLDLGADIDARGSGMSDVVMRPLLLATYVGNEKIVRLLLDRGADISVHGTEAGNYMSLIAVAALSGKPDVMRLILDRSDEEFKHEYLYHGALAALNVGPLLEETDDNKRRNIIFNRRDSDVSQITTKLSRYGLDFGGSMPGAHNAMMLVWVLCAGSREIIEMILTRDADVEARFQGRPILHWACMGCPESAVQNLVDYGADVGSEQESGESVLHAAIQNPSDAVLRYLLSLHVNCNTSNHRGETPLHWAAAIGSEGKLDLLLAAKADISAIDNDGSTVLHYAMLNLNKANRMQGFQSLAMGRLDINATDAAGVTPLHLAAEHGSLARVTWALELGADIAATTNEGRTVLHTAATNSTEDCEPIIQLVLDKGAALHATDELGFTALHHAVRKPMFRPKWSDVLYDLTWSCYNKNETMQQCLAKVRLLLDRGSDKDVQDANGTTALHLACGLGYKSIVEELLNRGVRTDLRDYRGCTPLDVAGNEDIRVLLGDD